MFPLAVGHFVAASACSVVSFAGPAVVARLHILVSFGFGKLTILLALLPCLWQARQFNFDLTQVVTRVPNGKWFM